MRARSRPIGLLGPSRRRGSRNLSTSSTTCGRPSASPSSWVTSTAQHGWLSRCTSRSEPRHGRAIRVGGGVGGPAPAPARLVRRRARLRHLRSSGPRRPWRPRAHPTDRRGGGEWSARAFGVCDFAVGVTYWFYNQTDRGVALQERAVAKARVACDTTIEARILGTLSMAQDSFDRSLAASTAQSAIDVAGMADAPLFVSGGLLALLGTYVHREPERRPARDRRPALSNARFCDDRWSLATATRLKAHALSRSGRLAEAQQRLCRGAGPEWSRRLR